MPEQTDFSAHIYYWILVSHDLIFEIFFSLFNRKRLAKRKARNVFLKASYWYRLLPNFTGNSNFQRTMEIWSRANFSIVRVKKKILKTESDQFTKRGLSQELCGRKGVYSVMWPLYFVPCFFTCKQR